MALAILRTAWHIGFESAHALTDGFDVKQRDRLKQRAAAVAGVIQVVDLWARYLGTAIAVDVTITVSAQLGVTEAHEISERVERSLLGDGAVQFVHVHVEPAADLNVVP